MQDLHTVFVVAVVAFVVLIGVMVVVHEFGHFAVAKLCGVRVESFSVGFGPRLFGIKYGDTDYKVCLLPLGGYVKMTGETPDQIQAGENMKLEADSAERLDALEADPGAFTSATPRWQRMLIGVAGSRWPTSILAFGADGLFYYYFGWINEEFRSTKVIRRQTVVEWVVPGSPAAQAGIHPGDVIRRFDSYDNPDWVHGWRTSAPAR